MLIYYDTDTQSANFQGNPEASGNPEDNRQATWILF